MYYQPQVQQPIYQNESSNPYMQMQNFQQYKQQNGYVAPTYTPYFNQMETKPSETMTDVYGIEGAKAYLVGAGNIATLFDNENKNVFYRKGADKSGKVNLFEIYKYQKIDEHELKNNSEVQSTKENQNEIEDLRNQIDELRKSINQIRQQQSMKKPQCKKETAE